MSTSAGWVMAAGVGYAQLPHYLVHAELASGRLITVLDAIVEAL